MFPGVFGISAFFSHFGGLQGTRGWWDVWMEHLSRLSVRICGTSWLGFSVTWFLKGMHSTERSSSGYCLLKACYLQAYSSRALGIRGLLGTGVMVNV